MEKYLNIEEINNIVEENYNKKYDKLTAFIKDEDISEVLLKDKSATISPKVIRFIMGEYLNLKEITKLDNVDNIGYSLDENSFRKALEKIYIASCKDNKTKNILYPYCIFASNEQINNLYKEAKDIASARFKYAAFMLEAIALNGTKTALNLVYEASKKFKQNTVRFTCKAILNLITKEAQMPLEVFADKIVPDFDFDANGIRIVESEDETIKKKFKIILKYDFSFSILDEDKNKEFKTFPKDFPASVKKELSKLKSEINRVIKMQTERLQFSFMDGRKWTLKDWKELFFENPLMKEFAIKLIWGIYDKKNKLLKTFRYMEDGTFNNEDDEEIKIEETKSKEKILIGLISPIETDKKIIVKWKKQLEDYEIVQPFNQLSTETKEEIIKKIPSVVTVGTIRRLASKLNMETENGEGGIIYGYYLFDTYNETYIEILTPSIYYGIDNNEEIEIKINFRNADERFEYGAYLMISNYLK